MAANNKPEHEWEVFTLDKEVRAYLRSKIKRTLMKLAGWFWELPPGQERDAITHHIQLYIRRYKELGGSQEDIDQIMRQR